MSVQLTKEQELGEKWAMENGTHALLHKTIQNKPCGCTVAGAGNLKSPVRVEFCDQHAKAFQVIRDIYVQHECNRAENFCRICNIVEEAGFKFP